MFLKLLTSSARLDILKENAAANGVQARRIDPSELRELEPRVAGIAALHVPEAGITDYRQICQMLAELLRGAGHDVHTGTRVTGIKEQNDLVRILTATGEFEAIW